MKWMKWTGRSPVERAAAALPNLRRRCDRRTINRRPTLRRDRAVELNGLTKKFQRLCSRAREVSVVSVRGFAVESAVLSGYLHATWRAFEKRCAGDRARYSPLHRFCCSVDLCNSGFQPDPSSELPACSLRPGRDAQSTRQAGCLCYVLLRRAQRVPPAAAPSVRFPIRNIRAMRGWIRSRV